MQVVDAVYYDLVDRGTYILRETKVTVPTHMVLHHGFELQPLKATGRSSKKLKSLARDGAMILGEDDAETIEDNLPE